MISILASHLTKLEFPKVLTQLAGYTDFSAGKELALALMPLTDHREIRRQLTLTTEARTLLSESPGIALGGAHDLRPIVTATGRGVVLAPGELLDVRDTLVSARTIRRYIMRVERQFPHLADIAARLVPCPAIEAEIGRCLDERGEMRDNASVELARIRREERIAHGRIQDKLQRIISSPKTVPYLQEALITQREGRYVIPLKADFKGRIRGIVHDVSASGATIFIEPLAVVELNNAWRELQLQEQEEMQRILRQLSAQIAAQANEIIATVEALAELDLVFAKARYAEAIHATCPTIVTDSPGTPTIRLIGARHPLLDPTTVVPIDIALDDDVHVLVITGPNTGGKTVTLKTMGLLAAMAQAGLHLPVEPGSALTPFRSIYADIGDEQSIEQSLSTFSAHLTNILSFLDKADAHSLILLDELGAGTDPAEGAALARALLDHFRQRGATTFVATHYPELKTYAQLTPGVCNACVEFDPETLSPTYTLTIGLPGRSNAFAIAERLGMPATIVQAARRLVSPDDMRVEDMLTDLHQLRLQAVQERDEAHAARKEAERLVHQLQQRLDHIEEERRVLLAQAQEEIAAELEELRAEARGLRRRLQATAAPLETIATITETLEQLDALEETVVLEPEAPAAVPTPLPSRPIRAHDTVWVAPLRTTGEVLSIAGDEAEVQIGPARTRVRVEELELRGKPRPTPPPIPQVRPAASPGTRLDLRGCTVEEALERTERHLDAASRAALPWVRIIHGKGTGALRRAIRRALSDHPLVNGYQGGADNEGGEGVTIVRLIG